MISKKLAGLMIAAVISLSVITSAAFSGTTHTEGGRVNDAPNGMNASSATFRVFKASNVTEVVTGTVQYLGGALSGFFWRADVGFLLPTQWLVGDDHIALIDKETGAGTPDRKGFYAVINKDLTSNDPDLFDQCTLRPIPVPSAGAGSNRVMLNWQKAVADIGTPDHSSDNIQGYDVYRASTPTGPYIKINTSTVPSANYLDTTAVNGATYYYATQLVYRGTGGASPLSLYMSGNSYAVIPTNSPSILSVVPNYAYQGTTVTIDVIGSNTNFKSVSSLVKFSGTGITVNNITVIDPTHLTATVTISPVAAPTNRSFSVVTGTEVATYASGFDIIGVGTGPALIHIDPVTAKRGETLNVNIEGYQTHFAAGSSVVSFSGGDITVNSVSVKDQLHLTAGITVGKKAALGTRSVRVTTGSEIADGVGITFTIIEDTSDAVPPVISDVRSDTRLVLSRDIIASKPVITARITDNIEVDPDSILVKIAGSTYDKGSMPPVSYDTATKTMRIAFSDKIPSSEVELVIEAKDYSGNLAEYRVDLKVSSGDIYIDGRVINYPNPFDPNHEETKISFNLSADAAIDILVFDMTGRIIAKRAHDGKTGYNEIIWDGRDDFGNIAANGVYPSRVMAGGKVLGKLKMWVVKK